MWFWRIYYLKPTLQGFSFLLCDLLLSQCIIQWFPFVTFVISNIQQFFVCEITSFLLVALFMNLGSVFLQHLAVLLFSYSPHYIIIHKHASIAVDSILVLSGTFLTPAPVSVLITFFTHSQRPTFRPLPCSNFQMTFSTYGVINGMVFLRSKYTQSAQLFPSFSVLVTYE